MASKRKLSKRETQDAIPLLKEFNKLSKAFIGLLGQKVETKRKRVNTLSVMVTGMKIPVQTNSTLSIQTVDMQDTRVNRKGSAKSTKRMKWEDDFRNRNRGIIL